MNLEGALHIHSSFSYDAKLSLTELRALGLRSGLQFMCLTEHDVDMTDEKAARFIQECYALSDKQFVLIPGFEITYKDSHTLMIGVKTISFTYEPLEILARGKEQGAWIVLAHPHRNHFVVDEAHEKLLDGVEVWNGQYDGKRYPRFRAMRYAKKMRARHLSILMCAGLDLHRDSHIGGPHVFLRVKRFHQERILRALKDGHYYNQGMRASFSSHSNPQIWEGLPFIIGNIFFGGTLTALKWLSGVLSSYHIPVPKRLKELIRRFF
jgi:hypothetical protein